MTYRRIAAYFTVPGILIAALLLAVSPISAQDLTVSDGTPSRIPIDLPDGTFELTIVVPEGWFQDFADPSHTLYAASTEQAIEKSNDKDAEFEAGEISLSIAPPSLFEQINLPSNATPDDTLSAFIAALDAKGKIEADDSFDVPAARAVVTDSVIPTGSSTVFALAFDAGTVLVAVLPGGAVDPAVIEILQSIRLDEVETPVASNLLHQWASRASGTTQYGKERWSFMQTTGAPDTETCGDIDTAWASLHNTGMDTLVLEYDQPVIPTQINVYETYTPGSIVSIEVGSSATDEWSEPLPNSVDAPGNTPCPGIFTVDVSDIDTLVDRVRITLDQSIGGNWNEIDAVELVGVQDDTMPPPAPIDDSGETVAQWAEEATGTSQYGDNSWSFMQATGEPNTEACGDQSTAWASSRSNGKDMLILAYAEPVIPTQINIYQTFNPGSITKVEVGSSATDEWSEPLPNSTDAPGNTLCPGVFTVNVSGIETPVDQVRIYVDQTIGGSWNEIDAVELVGTPAD